MALGAQQVKIWKIGQQSRHYIAEILLNVKFNHNQPTNWTNPTQELSFPLHCNYGDASLAQ